MPSQLFFILVDRGYPVWFSGIRDHHFWKWEPGIVIFSTIFKRYSGIWIQLSGSAIGLNWINKLVFDSALTSFGVPRGGHVITLGTMVLFYLCPKPVVQEKCLHHLCRKNRSLLMTNFCFNFLQFCRQFQHDLSLTMFVRRTCSFDQIPCFESKR